jgi:hypothetical protein
MSTHSDQQMAGQAIQQDISETKYSHDDKSNCIVILENDSSAKVLLLCAKLWHSV